MGRPVNPGGPHFVWPTLRLVVSGAYGAVRLGSAGGARSVPATGFWGSRRFWHSRFIHCNRCGRWDRVSNCKLRR